VRLVKRNSLSGRLKRQIDCGRVGGLGGGVSKGPLGGLMTQCLFLIVLIAIVTEGLGITRVKKKWSVTGVPDC